MKILYVVSTLKRCGPTNQLLGIIRHLDRTRFAPTVLTLSPEPAESRWDDFVVAGVDVRSLALGRLAGALLGGGRFARMVAELAPDILHSQGFRGDILCSRLCGTALPHVATVRNYAYKDYVMTYGRLRGQWMAKRHLRCLQHAAAVVFVSRAIREMVGFPIDNPHVVHNGVDIDLYVPVSQEQRRQLRLSFNLPESRRIYISTGHLDPRKDPAVAIEGVLAGDADGLMLMLGDGSLRTELEMRYRQAADRVRFVGRVPNVHEYLQASDYFVSASLAEGLPNAVLEALACGLPCFLSDIPEHREIVSDSELQPFLFKVGQSAALSAVIAGHAETDYSRDSRNARLLVEENFSQQAMSARYQALYAELVR